MWNRSKKQDTGYKIVSLDDCRNKLLKSLFVNRYSIFNNKESNGRSLNIIRDAIPVKRANSPLITQMNAEKISDNLHYLRETNINR